MSYLDGWYQTIWGGNYYRCHVVDSNGIEMNMRITEAFNHDGSIVAINLSNTYCVISREFIRIASYNLSFEDVKTLSLLNSQMKEWE